MIPPILTTDNHSDAERTVFRLLQGVDLGDGSRCFHSLNLSRHEYKMCGELDFVILSPLGVIALEIKGGGVRCTDGLWTFTDRYGVPHRRVESPFQQAKSGMFALRRALQDQVRSSSLGGVAFGYGVVFPDCDFDVASVEWPTESVLDAARIRGDGGVRRFLVGLFAYWRSVEHIGSSAPHILLDEISRCMRPDFDKLPSLRNRADQLDAVMDRLTETQFQLLDYAAANPRILCHGGAGTGKTFLAVETARRHAASGEHVLMLCRGVTLASFLAERLYSTSVVVGTFAGTPSERTRAAAPFDTLVVDEAQDFLNLDALGVLDELLRGGLSDGTWRFFYDSNNQSALFGGFSTDAIELLQHCGGIQTSLTRNCRNTSEIVIQTKLLTGADVGIAIAGHGPPVKTVSFEDSAEAAQLLANHLDQLHQNGVEPRDITILSPDSLDSSCVARLPSALRRTVDVLGDADVRWPPSRTTFATVAEFKGLENRFIALVDISAIDDTPRDLSLLYVGMSRARAGLWIAVRRGLEDRMKELSIHNLALVEKDIHASRA